MPRIGEVAVRGLDGHTDRKFRTFVLSVRPPIDPTGLLALNDLESAGRLARPPNHGATVLGVELGRLLDCPREDRGVGYRGDIHRALADDPRSVRCVCKVVRVLAYDRKPARDLVVGERLLPSAEQPPVEVPMGGLHPIGELVPDLRELLRVAAAGG